MVQRVRTLIQALLQVALHYCWMLALSLTAVTRPAHLPPRRDTSR
jgi:hypothetical protein